MSPVDIESEVSGCKRGTQGDRVKEDESGEESRPVGAATTNRWLSEAILCA